MWNLAAKVFGGIGMATALFLGLRLLWLNPEWVNGTARGYVAHIAVLKTDSTRWQNRAKTWRSDSLALRDTIAVRDALIAIQKREWKKAITYGNEYKTLWSQQVARADATSDKLTDREAELAYYYALQKNGTLPPSGVPLELLKPTAPDVLRAGLRTADREAIGRNVIDSLGRSVGLLRAKTERLGKGLALATSGLSTLSKSTFAKGKTGGIYPFNHRRRREEQAIAQSLDSLTVEVNKVSELENSLNKP